MSLLSSTDGALRAAQIAFLRASADASHALYKLDHLMPRKQLEVWLNEALPEVQAMAQNLRATAPAAPTQGGSHDGAQAPAKPLTPSSTGDLTS